MYVCVCQGAGGGAAGQEVGEREGQVGGSETQHAQYFTVCYIYYYVLLKITTLRVKLYETSHAEIIVFAF